MNISCTHFKISFPHYEEEELKNLGIIYFQFL